MGGSLLQLVAVGVQDIYLIGNPQITYFKNVFKKYTNFAIESIQQVFDGSNDFGQLCKVIIDRKGDLIKDIFFEILLPDLPAGYYWTNGIGNVLLKQVDLEIGGQLIDRHYSEWLDIWSQLTTTAGKMGSYDAMVGNFETISSTNSNSQSQLRLHIPLFFWFNRDYGMALPLIALQYHDVALKIQFRAFNECIRNDNTNDPIANISFITCECWVDYIMLDTEERRKFANTSHEYLIEQLQFSEDTSIPASSTNYSCALRFNHPVKELYWIHVPNKYEQANYLTGNQQLNYSLPNDTETFKNGVLYLNGSERFNSRPSTYFRLVQDYQYHTRYSGKNIYTYSFGLYPEKSQPSGTCNMSKFTSITLYLDYLTINKAGYDMILKVYAVNYNILRIMSGMGGLSFSN
jgi:hypothetical protein